MLVLSTNSLVGLIGRSTDHREVGAILAELKSRSDLGSINPVREVAVDSRRPATLRQAAVELATDLNATETIRWFAEQAESLSATAHARKLAIQALAWCRRPADTLHILERIAARQGDGGVRVTAVCTAASFRNVRSVALLLKLSRERDAAIADEAQAGLDLIFKHYGGVTAVVERLKKRAEDLAAKGQNGTALAVLDTARELSPADGTVRSLISRVRAA
jgi:hypothetical protein